MKMTENGRGGGAFQAPHLGSANEQAKFGLLIYFKNYILTVQLRTFLGSIRGEFALDKI